MTREETIAFGKRVIDLGFKDETAEFCEMAISALSAEGEYIKKKDALNILPKYRLEDSKIAEEIKALSTYSFPDKKGEWIKVLRDGCYTQYEHKCSCCQHTGVITFNFCPNCGADMRGKE